MKNRVRKEMAAAGTFGAGRRPWLIVAVSCLFFMLNAVPAFSLCGDVNGDGAVTHADVVAVMQAMTGGAGPSSAMVALTDAVISASGETPDGKLLSNDLFLLTRAAEGKVVLQCDEGGAELQGTVAAPGGVLIGESASDAGGGLSLKKDAAITVYGIGNDGVVGAKPLQKSVTDNNGTYILILPAGAQAGLLAVAGSDANEMRTLVAGGGANLSPASEFVTLNILRSGNPLSEFSSEELINIYNAAAEAAAGYDLSGAADVEAAVAALGEYPGMAAIVAMIAAAGGAEAPEEPETNEAPVIAGCSLSSSILVAGGAAATLECEVSDADGNLDAVTANLSAIGGGEIAMSGGAVWSADVSAAADTTRGVYGIVVTATDAEGETDTEQVNLAVDAPASPLARTLVQDDELGEVESLSDEYVVSLSGGDASALEAAVAELGGVVEESSLVAGMYLVRLPAGTDSTTAEAAISSAAGVTGTVPNIAFGITGYIPNDPPYDAAADQVDRWGYEMVSAPEAWERAENNAQPVIAVIDTGVDSAVADLAGRVSGGANFLGGAATGDDNGHGTRIAGIAAAAGDNGAGIAGVCWHCDIMPLKACDSGGVCPFYSVLEAIVYAADNGADVINLSVVGDAEEGTAARNIFQAIVNYAAGKGAVVVASAGNNSEDTANIVPASLAGVIAVAATDASDSMNAFSNYGADVDIAAPGQGILTLEPGGGTGYMTGTSGAAAFVSGAAGMLLSHSPSLTADAVAQAITGGADAVALNPSIGGGRLNLFSALKPFLTNLAPVIVSVSVSQAEVNPGDMVALDVQATDPDLDALTYQWTVTDGALSSETSAAPIWTLPVTCGTLEATVVVSDGAGNSVSGSVTVSSGASDFAFIFINPVQVDVNQGETVQLTAFGQSPDFTTCEIYPEWTVESAAGTIAQDGEFTALQPGSAIVTATLGALSAQSTVDIHDVTPPEDLVVAGTCTVTNSNDTGAGSLRNCIDQVNLNIGADTINFNAGLAGQTITLGSNLPTLTDDNTTITNNTAGEIIISGNGQAVTNCFTISSEGNVIRGLTIVECRFGIYINGAGADDNTIVGNYIGIDKSNASRPHVNGVYVGTGISGTVIGGSNAADRNVISSTNCVYLNNSTQVTVQGNYLGLNTSGTAASGGCTGVGLWITGATDSLIGGPNAGQGNVIGGCPNNGVYIVNASHRTTVQGNYIGTDKNGTTAIPTDTGVSSDDTNDVIIGGNTAGKRNVISGNSNRGVVFRNSTGIIQGNYIGMGADGTTSLGNVKEGILLASGTHDTMIGGSGAGEPNLIANNRRQGIRLINDPTRRNTFTENLVYNNGQGAYLDIDTATSNNNIQPPVLSLAPNGSNYDLSGTLNCGAYPCLVEIYLTDSIADGVSPNAMGAGGGYSLYQTVTINNPNNSFTLVNVSISADATEITSTLTDNDGNTSEYSDNISTDLNDPPVVESCSFSPDPLQVDGVTTTTLTCDVSDLDGDSDVDTVTVDLTEIGGLINAALADPDGDGNWVLAGILPDINTEILTSTFTVTATDSEGEVDTGDVDLELTGLPPVLDCDFTPGTIAADGVTTTTLECEVTDPNDDVDTVTVNLTALGGAAVESFVQTGPNQGEVANITADVTTTIQTHTFTVTATDQSGLVTTFDVDLTVTGVPPEVSNCTFTPNLIPADGVTTTILECEVTDANDDIDTVKVNLIALGDGAAAPLTDTGIGNIWKRTGITAAGTTAIQVHNLSITVTDTTGATDTDTASIEIQGAPPSISGCTFTPNTIPNDNTTTTVIECTVIDPNGVADIDSVKVDLTNLGGAADAALVNTGGNTWQLSGITAATDTVVANYTPDVTVTDLSGASDTDTPSITITNAPPTVTNCEFDPTEVPENDFTETTLTCTVEDPNGLADIDEVTVDLSDLGYGTGNLTHVSGTKWELTGIKAKTTTAAGTYTTDVTVTDLDGASDTDSPTIDVVIIPPEITGCSFDPTSVPADDTTTTKLTCTVMAPTNFVDTVTIDLTAIGGAADAGLTEVASGVWELDGITADGSSLQQVHTFTATVTDKASDSDTNTVDLEVTGIAPVVNSCSFIPASIPADATTTTKLSCNVTDGNGDLDTVTVDLGVLGGSGTAALTNTVGDTWELDGITADVTTAIQTHDITVTATDLASDTGNGTAALAVTGSPPDVTNCVFDPNSIPADGATTTTLSCDVTDANNNLDTVTVDLTAIGGAADAALTDVGGNRWERTGIIAPGGTAAGNNTHIITATDLSLLAASSTAALNISGSPPEVTNCLFNPNRIQGDGVETTTLTCDVTDSDGDLDTVIADLSVIGGATESTMIDAGGGTWKLENITVPATVAPATYAPVVTGTDAEGNLDTDSANITIENSGPNFDSCIFNPMYVPTDGVTAATLTCVVYEPNGDPFTVEVDLSAFGLGVQTLTLVSGDIYQLTNIIVDPSTPPGVYNTDVTATDIYGGVSTTSGIVLVDIMPEVECSSGNLILPHIVAPTPDGELFFPQEIAVDTSGNIFVTNLSNNRIEKYDSDCNYLMNWGSSGSSEEQFNQPKGIIYNEAAGMLYISDRYDYIRIYDTEGNYVDRWRSSEVVSIAADSSGNIYVASTEAAGKVYIYDQAGAELDSWDAVDDPGGIAVSDSGEVFIADQNSHTIRKYDSSGTHLMDIGSEGTAPGKLIYPYGLHVDGTTLYVANKNNHRIDIFDTGGSFLFYFGENGRDTGELYYPNDVIKTPDGNIIVLEQSNDRLQVFSGLP